MREYRLRRRVQFHETDAAGIVHFSAFFKYMEEAEHALWRDAGLSIHPPGTEIGWPRVAAAFEYRQPLAFEEEFEVALRVEDVRKKTIRYTCRVTRGDTEIASGSLTIVCVRRVAGEAVRAIEIPNEIAETLRGF